MLVRLEQNILLMERYLDFGMEWRRMGMQGTHRQGKVVRVVREFYVLRQVNTIQKKFYLLKPISNPNIHY